MLTVLLQSTAPELTPFYPVIIYTGIKKKTPINRIKQAFRAELIKKKHVNGYIKPIYSHYVFITCFRGFIFLTLEMW